MRAAASKAPVRVRNWQSQRVTRRSLGAPELAGSVFHPVPSQRGQTSAAVLINLNPSSSVVLNSIFPEFYYSTVHRGGSFGQARNAKCLCRTCEGVARAVEKSGKHPRFTPESARAAPIRDWGVRNRLRARIFTVDILPGERKIPPVRFPRSDTILCHPGVCWV